MGPTARSRATAAARANGVHRLAIMPIEGRVPRAGLCRRRAFAPPVALHDLNKDVKVSYGGNSVTWLPTRESSKCKSF